MGEPMKQTESEQAIPEMHARVWISHRAFYHPEPPYGEKEENGTFYVRQDIADERVREREDLINHMRVHSGYLNCGYRQMTTEQKELYDAIWAKEVAAMDAEEARAAEGKE